MGAMRTFCVAVACGLLSAAVATTAQATAGLSGNDFAAPALPPKGYTTAKPAAWVQKEGYVPVPDTLTRPAAPAAATSNALPPASQWATIDLDKPFEDDPTGTNVFANAKYAPAAVRAAIERRENPEFDATSTASVFAPTASINVGGMTGGMGGGLGGGLSGAGQGAMLQQSFGPTAPSTDVFAKGNAAAAGMGGAAPANPSNEVFTGGNQQFNNQYQASVGNAMGSSDLLVKMIIEAPEQQVAVLGADAIRSQMGRMSNTPPARIFVYQTRTINGAGGQPHTAIAFLFKNSLDAERSRQATTFGSSDVMEGFMRDVQKATKLKITPKSIQVSSAVNDGGMEGAPAAMPGQLAGQMGGAGMMTNGGMMMPNAGMMMPGGMTVPGMAAPVAAVPAAPAKSSASGTSGGVFTVFAMLLSAVLAF